MKPELESVRNILLDTVTLLCKNSLNFKHQLKVQGLLGITLDDDEVFLVHINEQFQESSNSKYNASPELQAEVHISHPQSRPFFKYTENAAAICRNRKRRRSVQTPIVTSAASSEDYKTQITSVNSKENSLQVRKTEDIDVEIKLEEPDALDNVIFRPLHNADVKDNNELTEFIGIVESLDETPSRKKMSFTEIQNDRNMQSPSGALVEYDAAQLLVDLTDTESGRSMSHRDHTGWHTPYSTHHQSTSGEVDIWPGMSPRHTAQMTHRRRSYKSDLIGYSRGGLDVGGRRFPCQFPGCVETFAQVCSAMRHERNQHKFWRRLGGGAGGGASVADGNDDLPN